MTRETRSSWIAFWTAFVALFTQVLVHRMVSAKLLNNFAFLVISLTMLGFASSGAFLSRYRGRLMARIEETLPIAACLFTLTLLGASALFYRAADADGPPTVAGFASAYLYSALLAVLYAVPFGFCGLILGLLLSDPDLRVRRVYFFDLLGSALGAILVIPAITSLGVERSAVLGCAVLLLSVLLFSPPRSPSTRGWSVAAVLAVLVSGLWPESIFHMTYPSRSWLGQTQVAGSNYTLEYIEWDPVARIEVSRIPPPSGFGWRSLIGTNPALARRIERVLTQNNNAFTYALSYDGRKESLEGVDGTIYAAAYETSATRTPKALVIGVGGGFDILTALRYDASSVVGVEVNGATLDILKRQYRSYFKAWVEDPRVTLVHDDGRHYLASNSETYDILQLSGVDSNSGTNAAAQVFSESYLYSSEAFDLYFSRLRPDGIMNLMRMEYAPPRHMLRALVTAVASLRRAGVARPAQHIVMVTADDGSFTAMLVKKTPFTTEETERTRAWAARTGLLHVSAAPDGSGGRNEYQAFLSLGDPATEARLAQSYPFDIRPATDDWPFFFRHSYWWHLWSTNPPIKSLPAGLPALELGLIVLFTISVTAAVLFVYVPLRLLASRGLTIPHQNRYVIYFASIGVGYLALEVGLIQKLGLFLGHPNYSLSVVLASLLMASGLGALFSERLLRALGNRPRFVSMTLAMLVLFEVLVVLPLLPGLVAQPFVVRVLLAAALVFPVGLLLGVYFPVGLEQLKRQAPDFTPWAWGVNGIASVVAPVLSVAISTAWGTQSLLLAALPVYLLAGWALPDGVGNADASRRTAGA